MIPVIVNNRDLDPGRLIGQIQCLDEVGEVHLIDNGSTYPPLVRWLDSFQFDSRLTVHRWENVGPRAACRLVHQLRERWTSEGVQHYATTDSDIDLDGVPSDALDVFRGILSVNRLYVKAGCALRINDLPKTDIGLLAKSHEERFWKIDWPQEKMWRVKHLPCFEADIDTTFALYRLNPPWNGSYGPSVRVAGKYQARHLPWYHTRDNRPADYRWYMEHCDAGQTVYTRMAKQCNQ